MFCRCAPPATRSLLRVAHTPHRILSSRQRSVALANPRLSHRQGLNIATMSAWTNLWMHCQTSPSTEVEQTYVLSWSLVPDATDFKSSGFWVNPSRVAAYSSKHINIFNSCCAPKTNQIHPGTYQTACTCWECCRCKGANHCRPIGNEVSWPHLSLNPQTGIGPQIRVENLQQYYPQCLTRIHN